MNKLVRNAAKAAARLELERLAANNGDPPPEVEADAEEEEEGVLWAVCGECLKWRMVSKRPGEDYRYVCSDTNYTLNKRSAKCSARLEPGGENV